MGGRRITTNPFGIARKSSDRTDAVEGVFRAAGGAQLVVSSGKQSAANPAAGLVPRGRSRDAAKRVWKPGLKIEHSHPGRAKVDAGHPGPRLVNLGKIRLGRFLAQVAAGRRRVPVRDAIDLRDCHRPRIVSTSGGNASVSIVT